MAQSVIKGGGAFTRQNIENLNDNFTALFGALLSVGAVYYCNPLTAVAVAEQDGSLEKPFITLLAAYNACVSGHNDTVVLIGDGASAGTARVDAAFTWSKDATNLLGICSPSLFSQRARIAPTGTTTAFKLFFTISGNGCVFQNIQWFQGFNTGTTAQICLTLTGSRNVFRKCHIAGMGDTASATDAGSRSLKIGLAGAGENLFEDCVIGIDTVARTGHNASIEFTAATPRNVFRRCILPVDAGDANPYFLIGTGNECVDRFNEFEQCSFVNTSSSGATALTVAGSFSTASPGGLILLRDCVLWGGNSSTNWGDANFMANAYIDMAAPATSTGGLAVVPS